jgi:hypothetical protein
VLDGFRRNIAVVSKESDGALSWNSAAAEKTREIDVILFLYPVEKLRPEQERVHAPPRCLQTDPFSNATYSDSSGLKLQPVI